MLANFGASPEAPARPAAAAAAATAAASYYDTSLTSPTGVADLRGRQLDFSSHSVAAGGAGGADMSSSQSQGGVGGGGGEGKYPYTVGFDTSGDGFSREYAFTQELRRILNAVQ